MFKNIIIPIDLADKHTIAAIVPKALSLASMYQAKLHFLYIISDFGMKMVEDYLPKNFANEQKEKYRLQLKNLIRKYVPEEIEAEFHIARGGVYDEVIQYSNEIKADLIIIAAVRPQLRDYMLGPNASKIVRHSSISVLVVRED